MKQKHESSAVRYGKTFNRLSKIMYAIMMEYTESRRETMRNKNFFNVNNNKHLSFSNSITFPGAYILEEFFYIVPHPMGNYAKQQNAMFHNENAQTDGIRI